MDMECVFESVTEKGSIYISNYEAAQNLELLKGNLNANSAKRIQAIISVARSGLLTHSK